MNSVSDSSQIECTSTVGSQETPPLKHVLTPNQVKCPTVTPILNLSTTSPISDRENLITSITAENDTKGIAPPPSPATCNKPAAASKRPFPVFDHILLLPPSHHRSSKTESIPSNYLTPEEEEAEQNRLLRMERKRKRAALELQKKESASSRSNNNDKLNRVQGYFEVGRSGRIRKKPKSFSDYVMENSIKDPEDIDRYSPTIDYDEDEPAYNYESDYDEDDDEDDGHDYDDIDDEKEDFLRETDSFSAAAQSAISKKQNKAYWDMQVEALRQFKALHGHTRVSQRKSQNLELARWVKKIREKYKKVQRGLNVPSLSDQRIAQLNKIGFVWSVRGADFKVNFDQHMLDLLEFQREHGHTRVPHVYPKNPKLGRWCHHIKLSYRKLEQGEKPMIKLRQEQIDKLNEINFQWKIRFLVATNKDDNEDNFDAQLDKLKAFKETNGHCDVNKHCNARDDNLACWVASLKSSYRQLRQGERPIMRLNEKQISRLNELGFDWSENFKSSSVRTKSILVPWSERYTQLCEYKERYGNCRVPSKYADDKAFGNWVSFQRSALGAKIVGKKSCLSDEQQKKFEEVGLEWTVYKMDIHNDHGEEQNSHSNSKHDQTFEQHLNDLKAFHSLHGHFNVPKEKKSLFNWIKNIRYEKLSLSEERIFALNSLGLAITPKERRHSKTKPKDSSSKQGTKSQKYEKISPLSINDEWMKGLRLGFEMKNTSSSKKTPGLQKPLALDWYTNLKLGFIFEEDVGSHKESPKASKTIRGKRKSFESYIEELKIHKDKYGHMNVSPKQNKSLCAWTSNIRMSYKRLHEGRPQLIKLTPERMKSLVDIGFEFTYVPRRGKIVETEQPKSNAQVKTVMPILKSKEVKHSADCNNNFKKRSQKDPTLQSSPKHRKVEEISLNHREKSSDLGFEHESIQRWCMNLKLGFVAEGLETYSRNAEPQCHEATKRGKRRSFESYVEELKIHKDKYGHMDVSAKQNKSLCAWVSNIKMSYKRLHEGRPLLIKLTPERMKSLVDIGFEFTYVPQKCRIAGREKYVVSPIINSKEVKHSTNNPTKKRPNISESVEGTGVLKNSPKRHKVGENVLSTSMDKSEMKLSDCESNTMQSMLKWCTDLKLGFIFEGISTGRSANYEVKRGRKSFESYVEELRTYKEAQGHINVSPKENKLLSAWVSNIKTGLQGGKKPPIKLTQERRKVLEGLGFELNSTTKQPEKKIFDAPSIQEPHLAKWCRQLGLGFDWACHSSRKNDKTPFICNNKPVTSVLKPKKVAKTQHSPERRTFDDRLAELKAFKETYGHLEMRKISKINKSLGNWCRNIKTSYGRFKKGKSIEGIRMTDERIQKVKAVGFALSSNREFDCPDHNSAIQKTKGANMKEQLQIVPIENVKEDIKEKKTGAQEQCVTYWI